MYRFEDRIKKPHKYIPAEKTDVGRTIRRALRVLKLEQLKAASNVRPMRSKEKAAA